MATITYVQHLADLAAADPHRPAVTCGDEVLTRAQLSSAGARLGRDFAERGVGVGDFVTIAVPNSVDWYVACVASWSVGAIPQPASAKLPARELAAIIELARSKVTIGVDPSVLELVDPAVAQQISCLPFGYRPSDDLDDTPMTEAVSPAWKAPTSGGSTGRPKLIVAGDPALIDPAVDPILQFARDGCLVLPGPLYHNAPGVWSWIALLAGSQVVVLPRFDPEETLAAVERHRGDVLYMVPTMMKRILRLPDEIRTSFDLSSLRVVWHVAEPCPIWLKQAWIDWLGAERIWEIYGGTESQVATEIGGVDWLAHRGSVGRPMSGELMICDADGRQVGAGEEGEIWMRRAGPNPTYHYVGADARTLEGGWESIGDIGWLDADGFLYLGDRSSDMILVGGANVYPAEVEAALQEHPQINSTAVIGLPDDDKGSRIHAIVEADPASVSEVEILEFLSERLARYKLPRSIEFVDVPLRDDAGKSRRSQLRSERLQDASADR